MLPFSLYSQQTHSPPELTSLNLNEVANATINVDGLLSEAVWASADVASGFYQQEPLEGQAATEKTEIRIIYDKTTLYIGIMAYDSEPNKIVARVLQRDKIMQPHVFTQKPIFTGDDAVAIIIDPFHDHRNGFVFATNANGAEFDGLLSDEGREFNVDWRAIWEVSAKRLPDGWSAEMAIPFRTLRYPENSSSEPWGINFYRVIQRKQEEVLWTAWSRDNEGFARVSKAGHLQGMIDLPRPGLNMEVKPFGLTSVEQDSSGNEALQTATDAEVGLDLKWEVRPGLSLDVTLNTDFAQVEVDDEQVNLTRFELFFPEKRDFFLENSGVFEFGVRSPGEPPPYLLFFSRRIGISDSGIVPVLGGTRLSGRVGKQTIGLINVVTDDAYDVPLTNYAIGRYKRDVGSNNYVGAMVTDRRSDESFNTAVGLDGSFWPTTTLNVQSFVARTMSSGDVNDISYRIGMDYTADKFGFTLQHLSIGPDSEADIGFITRTDIRRTDGFTRISFRPNMLGLRAISNFWAGSYISRIDGALQDRNFGPALDFLWNSGDNITLFMQTGRSRLDESFDLAGEVPVDIGTYDFLWLGWFGTTSQSRPLVIGYNGFYQENFDGTLLTSGVDATVALGSHLNMSVAYVRNQADLPNGTVDADLVFTKIAYAFSKKLIANALIQYNGLDNDLSSNFRLNYIHRPGSDLFLVINEQRGSMNSLQNITRRDATVKLTYLMRI